MRAARVAGAGGAFASPASAGPKKRKCSLELFGRDGRPPADAGGDADAWPPFAITQILNGGEESYRIEKKGTGKIYSPTYHAGGLVRAWHKETNGWYLCVIVKFDNMPTLAPLA